MPDRTQCGDSLKDDAAFCGACGAPVVPTGAETDVPAAAPAPPPAGPAPSPPATPVVTASSGTNIVLYAALAVVAVVAAIGIFFIADRHSGTVANPAGANPGNVFQVQQTKAEDSAVKEGIHSIQIGIQSWAVDNGDVFPPASEVSKFGAVGTLVDNWPTNPFTGQPMAAGDLPGDFAYTLGTNSTMFQLSGHLSSGDFTVP
jgi:hypothetical protein